MSESSIAPPYLKKGDTIAIAAPARKISLEELHPSLSTLEEWGLHVVYSDLLFGEANQFSGSDADRSSDFQRWLDDPQVKAILCARGGYGTLRIIDQLDFTKFRQSPKWIAGYSDITVLHSHLHQLGYASLHATMPINFERDPASTETLRLALFGEPLHYTVNTPSGVSNRQGVAKGQLIGGNLSLLYAMQGSVSDIDTRNKILFIEDLDEYLYHVDRMMMSLKRSGKLSHLAGLIVGGMSEMKDNAIPFGKTAAEIIYNTIRDYDFPVCFGFLAGHGLQNFALRFGSTIILNVQPVETTLTEVML
jgi:muramoyltetrapeptide carboxypeptidase